MIVLHKIRGLFRSWALLGLLLLIALVCFEIFNFTTTQFGLLSLFPGQYFMNIPWANILALAACLTDFAGLARMFTPEQSRNEAVGVWIAVVGWFMAATINAGGTWWALVLTISNTSIKNTVIPAAAFHFWVPIIIAVFVWLMRISLIGGISLAGERFFWGSGNSSYDDYDNGFKSYKPLPPLRKPKATYHPVDD